MRLLFVTPFTPGVAAQHGGGVYLGALLQALSRQGAELALVHLVHEGEPNGLESAVPWRFRRGLPYLGRPPADGRLAHRLRLLWRWRRDPLLVAKHWQPGVPAALAEASAAFAPDVVFLEMVQMAQYLPCLRGVATVLTDHEAGRPANSATGLGAAADRRDRALWRSHLARHQHSATVLQALTEVDAASLRAEFGREVRVRPPLFHLPERPVDPARTPPRALFVGDYAHQPNREAARRLAQEVLPVLRSRVPAAELWLAGGNSEPIAELGALPGVRVLGFVEDLGALFAEVRLLLGPLWSGAGFRVKNLAALAHGLPVVTNALGARGLDVPTTARRVVEHAPDLVAAAAHWLTDAAAAAAAGRSAFTWARATLAPEAVAQQQLECAAFARALHPQQR